MRIIIALINSANYPDNWIVLTFNANHVLLTFVALESLTKEMPCTFATNSRRCSRPWKSIRLSRIVSFLMSNAFPVMAAAIELYWLCLPCSANSLMVMLNWFWLSWIFRVSPEIHPPSPERSFSVKEIADNDVIVLW